MLLDGQDGRDARRSIDKAAVYNCLTTFLGRIRMRIRLPAGAKVHSCELLSG